MPHGLLVSSDLFNQFQRRYSSEESRIKSLRHTSFTSSIIGNNEAFAPDALDYIEITPEFLTCCILVLEIGITYASSNYLMRYRAGLTPATRPDPRKWFIETRKPRCVTSPGYFAFLSGSYTIRVQQVSHCVPNGQTRKDN